MPDVSTGVSLAVDDRGVATVTIDRPDTGNSLTPAARDDLTAAFRAASADRAVRSVVLRSSGTRHFCTGAGLDATTAPPPERRPGDVARTLRDGWQQAVAAILDCDKPVVAAVQGTAAGAGASLVLACDLVVMSQTATLVEVFVRRGILPDAGAVHLLSRIVGVRRASELLLLGESISAADCERFGIVNRVVAPDEVDTVTDELAARLAAGPSVSIAMTKKLLRVAPESSRDRAFADEAWAQEFVSGTDDMAEGIAAFVERRPPVFRGR